MAELEGVHVAILGAEGRGGGRGHRDEREAQSFKLRWNGAAPSC